MPTRQAKMQWHALKWQVWLLQLPQNIIAKIPTWWTYISGVFSWNFLSTKSYLIWDAMESLKSRHEHLRIIYTPLNRILKKYYQWRSFTEDPLQWCKLTFIGQGHILGSCVENVHNKLSSMWHCTISIHHSTETLSKVKCFFPSGILWNGPQMFIPTNYCYTEVNQPVPPTPTKCTIFMQNDHQVSGKHQPCPISSFTTDLKII